MQRKDKLVITANSSAKTAVSLPGDIRQDPEETSAWGFWSYNPETDLFEFGDDFYAIYGTNAAREGTSMTPETYAEKFVHPDDAWVVRAGIISVQESSQQSLSGGLVHRGVRRTGETCFIESRAVIVKDAQGKIISWKGINQDVTIAKRIEKESDSSREQLAMAAELAKLGPWKYHHELDMFEFGDDFYAIYGTSVAREGPFMPARVYAREFVHPEEAWKVAAAFERIRASKEQHISVCVQSRIIRRDGVERAIVIKIKVVKDAEGNVLKWYGVNQDITEYLAMEKELHKSKENLSAAAELAKLGPWNYDPATNLLEGSDEFYAIYGTSVAREGRFRPIDAYFQNFVHPDDLQRVLDKVKNHRKIARARCRENILTSSFQMTHRILRRDGEERTITVRATYVFDAAGNFVKLYGANQDVTDYTNLEISHQQLAAKTRELENMTTNYHNEASRLQQLIDLCPLVIMMIDEQGRIVAANQALLNLMPQHKPVLGIHCDAVTAVLEPEEAASTIMRALRGEAVSEAVDGTGKRWFCSALPIRNPQTRQITGAIGLYNDITEYEQLREEVIKLDRYGLVAQMAAGVAHEIRNPMTVVRGYLQFLSSKMAKEYQEHFEMMIRELDGANSIITNFLSLAQKQSPELEKCDLNAIIAEIYPLIYSSAVRKGLLVDLQLGAEAMHVHVHVKEIKQLILNLCGNAEEAMEEKGRLTITTASDEKEIKMIVADTGCGIPREKIRKIFDPFYTTKYSGTGLGLAVCLNIAKRHNAKIEVKSKQNVGTEFIVTFPIEQ